ncbi:MAG TPA: S41 family peptidase [Candidatus Thiothrix moscowensis]|uniref:S41 family peptidase n=3 Tax=Thiothrix TaxID=1030 RepID=UPI001A1ABD40|nr:S41 family peptidase [uncultured Thiothrix sp.]MBJ6611113.1 S41 family peptidase [Candidatus Thiothrix moscowensis]HRJ52345.1 S41 family peptidase [Candidatus Thiothrix moscowensis]HRJ92660.1 S41 family peptidase [Candidatus Thiothrix moscowensis]
MHTRYRVLVGTMAGVLIGVTTSISLNVFAFKQTVESSPPLDELQQFSEVYSRIKESYVEEAKDKDLMTNAIRGMLNGLDPHSAYLDEDEFKELQVGTSGEFGGLGIEVGMEDGFVKVISPIDDTPAQQAGLQAGDLIIRLDTTPVKGMSLNDAVKLMRGKPGTNIDLMIVREGKDKPFKVSIKRAIIQVKSVKSKMLDPGYGYIRITSFQAKTTEAMLEALESLKKENNGKLRGLVLDLRNNPGGVLNAAVGVSDAFLESGKIVYTEGRVADAKMEYTANKGDSLENAPIVVLVNRGSASASEIVAGALKDHKRALIIGQKTFGKGSVQTVLPLDEKTAVKLTTARYFTPSGRSIQAEGIVPDIEIKPMKLKDDKNAEDDAFDPLTEADLNKHLDNPNGEKKSEQTATPAAPEEQTPEGKASPTEGATDKDSKEAKDNTTADKDKKPLAEEDYQLFEALNILKGMDLVINRTKTDPLPPKEASTEKVM